MKRKNFVHIVLVIFISAVTGATFANAQPCPAPPDCPNDPFIRQAPIYIAAPLSNGTLCSLKVEYCARIACGLWRDMYIDGIYFSEDCLTLTSAEIIDAAMDGIVGQKRNPWGATIPACQQWISSWRVFAAQCYAVESHPAEIAVSPCILSTLCWAEYKFCYDTLEKKIRHELLMKGQADPCPNLSVKPIPGECISFCPS